MRYRDVVKISLLLPLLYSNSVDDDHNNSRSRRSNFVLGLTAGGGHQRHYHHCHRLPNLCGQVFTTTSAATKSNLPFLPFPLIGRGGDSSSSSSRSIRFISWSLLSATNAAASGRTVDKMKSTSVTSSSGSRLPSTTATNSDSIPAQTSSSSSSNNWRVIQKQRQNEETENEEKERSLTNDDFMNRYYRDVLSERPTWSNDQYIDALRLYDELMSCSDSYVAPGIQSALNTLDHAFRLYGPESVIVSFNGGKDAVVILHLMRAAHAKYYNTTTTSASTTTSSLSISGDGRGRRVVRPRAVYFNHPDEFPEVTTFLHDSVKLYDLDMVAFEEGVKFADGLKIIVENNVATSSDTGGDSSSTSISSSVILPMAFVLGTRESDPNANGQDHFSPSSHWMPPFMRVNPILDWTYGHVWHFLRLFRLPYCSLYDQGYTSLGTTKDTVPCPALAVIRGDESTPTTMGVKDGEGTSDSTRNNNVPRFWPAYMLRDWDQERAGRVKKEKDGDKSTKTLSTASKAVKSPKRAVPDTHSSEGSSSNVPSLSTTPSVSGLTAVSNARQLTKGSNNNKSLLINSDDSTRGDGDDNAHDGDRGRDSVDDQLFLDQSLGSELSDDDDGGAKRVGILIVGDEILKGMTMDTNTNTAAQALRKECIQLARVVVVSDDTDGIAREIRRLRNEVDVVITSGGVGPTHDDVTIKGVAKALGRELVFHEEMGELLKQKMNTTGKDLTPAQLKMATLPSNAKLRYLSEVPDDWPVLQCRNIFVLPGVPEFFAKKIQNVAAYLSSQLERSVAYKIVLSCDEASIVDILNECVRNHPSVDFGSYPFVNHPEYKTVLTLEGTLVDDPTPAALLENSITNNPMDMSFSERKVSRNSVFFDRDALIIPKDVRDKCVRLALDELITKLPNDSILRVENEDETPLDN